MSSFIENLTRELHKYQDETTWLSVDTVKEMLTRAVNDSVTVPEKMRFFRQINPELDVVYVLEMENDFVLLWPEDVATLRALLMSTDENMPVQVGEPLSVPCKLPGGRVTSVVTQELLDIQNEKGDNDDNN